MKYGYLVISLLASSQLSVSPNVKSDFSEVIGDASFEMKSIAGGSFGMGCGIEDEPCSNEEGIDKSGGRSQRMVKVESFYLAETEMTWAIYQQCIDKGSCPDNESDGGDNGLGKGDRPVIEVSWNDLTLNFIPWINEVTGRSYRLPTEVEWEYAARAGTSTRFSWGNEIDCSKARYGYQVDLCGKQFGALPVKSFQANRYGLYDMHGNVWEMVQDCWSRDIGIDTPSGNESCDEIVLRGGSWLNEPLFLGSAARYRHDKTYRESGDGFRLAHDMD